MLDIRGLGVAYGNSRVIDHLDLSLSPGESISIVGESGAGKTTLGMAIMRLVKGSVSGQVIFNGGNLLDLSDEEMRRLRGDRISMVFQGVEDSLDPVYNVVDHVAEAVLSHRPLPRKEALERARAMLRAVGLEDEISELYPHQISGGQRQRALIAMALINDPEVLILDEPTASLDALTKADIIDLLRSASYGRITLAITHDFLWPQS
jgi:peptide/nickel transport system ATP-binding protein